MHRLILALVCFLVVGCATPPAPPPTDQAPPGGIPADRLSPLGGMCGGFRGMGCADPGAYCAFEPSAMCGAADQTGICRLPPQACTREYRPVCGCDNQTYSNPCSAAAAGTSIWSTGACPDPSGAK